MAVFDVFIVAVHSALFEHGVDKGCFTVVNVGNNGNIA